MALTHHIERAAYTESKPMDTFTDVAVVPSTFAECAIPDEDLWGALRYIFRNARDREDLVVLLDEILGEG